MCARNGGGGSPGPSVPIDAALDVLVHVHGPVSTADLSCITGTRHGALLGRAVGVEGKVDVSLSVVAPALDARLTSRTAADKKDKSVESREQAPNARRFIQRRRKENMPIANRLVTPEAPSKSTEGRFLHPADRRRTEMTT